MPGRFLEIPVFLGDCFIMPHPVYRRAVNGDDVDNISFTFSFTVLS